MVGMYDIFSFLLISENVKNCRNTLVAFIRPANNLSLKNIQRLCFGGFGLTCSNSGKCGKLNLNQ